MHRELGILPPGDLLIHAGDFMSSGHRPSELRDFDAWLSEQPYQEIAVVAGNHDLLLERFDYLAEEYLSSCRYLRDSGCEIDGIKIYGSPVTPRFMNWAFMLDRGSEEIKSCWDKIPNDLDILITHGPAWGILDKYEGKSLGCEELTAAIIRTKPRIHIFGHIHGGYGENYGDETWSFNVAVANERYKIVNAPTMFEINPAGG